MKVLKRDAIGVTLWISESMPIAGRRNDGTVTLTPLMRSETETLQLDGVLDYDLSPYGRRVLYRSIEGIYGWNKQTGSRLLVKGTLDRYPDAFYSKSRFNWAWTGDGNVAALFYSPPAENSSTLRCAMFETSKWRRLSDVPLDGEWGIVEWTRNGDLLICQRSDKAGRVEVAAIDRNGKMHSLIKDVGRVAGYVDWWEPPR